jgi:hypothetical protein
MENQYPEHCLAELGIGGGNMKRIMLSAGAVLLGITAYVLIGMALASAG